jgi:hypothetical protein
MTDQPAVQPDRAAAYVSIAKQVIPLAQYADDLRDWWIGETAYREDYGLTDEQNAEIVQACKDHLAVIGETPRPKPKPASPSKRRGYR